MADLSHNFGGDLASAANGDLATVSGTTLGQQRVLRRLLTNPGDYIWHPTYGAGLAQFVGQPVNALQITAVIRSQIFKEAAVARQPEPVITVLGQDDGSVFVEIRYVDASSGQTQILTFTVGR